MLPIHVCLILERELGKSSQCWAWVKYFHSWASK